MSDQADRNRGDPSPAGADKRPTGIAGFDQLSRGGLPAGAATLLLGEPGAGKTVFALQTVANAATSDGTGAIFVAFEEAPEAIKANVAGFDWAAGADALAGVHFLDGRGPLQATTTGNFDVSGLLAQLGELVRRQNAGWIVLDGLDNVLDLLSTETDRRREIYRIADYVAELGLPALITGKLRADDAQALGSFDAMQFAVQTVVKLTGRVTNDVFGRSLRIVKYRGSDHDNIETPFVINQGGIAVAYHGDGVPQHELSSDRLSTGVGGLDRVLDGGYQRGYAVLVSGAPGTAKTTLGASFLSAGADRGETGLLVALDETHAQIVANASGIGLNLERQIAEGRIHALSMRSAALAPEAFFLAIERAIRTHQPSMVVIDPISAVTETRDHRGPFDAAARLVDFCKTRGITLLTTTLAEGVDDADTRSRVSTLADAWIALSYQVQMGERNRALSVVKARGIAHSNQVRELLIGADGAHLAEVYAGSGEVLMGAARVAQQAQDELDDAERALATERRRRELEHTIAETQARREALDAALESARRELELTDKAERKRQELDADKAGRIRRRREGDGA
ncbi:MAG: circadian clock protein KaiC [Rhodovibrio sp.]|nr:circadian clock protein KaiC [Rhodovibrio sp.]